MHAGNIGAGNIRATNMLQAICVQGTEKATILYIIELCFTELQIHLVQLDISVCPFREEILVLFLNNNNYRHIHKIATC